MFFPLPMGPHFSGELAGFCCRRLVFLAVISWRGGGLVRDPVEAAFQGVTYIYIVRGERIILIFFSLKLFVLFLFSIYFLFSSLYFLFFYFYFPLFSAFSYLFFFRWDFVLVRVKLRVMEHRVAVVLREGNSTSLRSSLV